MVMLTLNAIFALGFASAGLNAARRGWPFVRHGWLLLSLNAPDAGLNVERRRAVSEGGRFLLGGALWLLSAAGALALAAYFGFQVMTALYF